MKAYLDNAATTKVDEKAIKAMLPYFNNSYGNPSSLHEAGAKGKNAMDRARKIIAKSLNAKSSEIYFTSGGTESNNWTIKGMFFENFPSKNHIITTKIEHDATLKTCQWLEKKGVKVTYLDVDKEGFIDLKQLKKSITKKTFLVTIIHGNNEIGTIQDLEAIHKITKQYDFPLHIDACQSYTKVPLNSLHAELITINAHKINGPKGVGALYIKDKLKLTPLMHGGGHERLQRSGTENIPGIVGFAKAVENTSKKDIERMIKLRDKLIKGILEIKHTTLNGAPIESNKRLPNNVNISFNDIEGEAIGGYLENKNIFVSTGSACMSNTLKSSHVLKAIGLGPLEANSAIRFSLSKYTTEKEIDYTIKKLPEIIRKLRRLSPVSK
ncbi:MAG: cysteine desulfurase family protein [Nanoarchaeota archaeon]|nr:cysteine desulfurase family protein [Nanoarchaeota archaeon]